MTGFAVWEASGVEGLEILGSPPVALAAGLLLLAFGRRLYWLLVAAAGFGLGYTFALRFLDFEAGTAALAAGVVAGVVGAVVVVLFQKVAVSALGFIAGGLATLYAAMALGWEAGWWVLVAALVAGIVGAVLARSIFELALVVFTSIAGAVIGVPALGVRAEIEAPLVVVLTVLGIVFQQSRGRRSRR